MKIRLVGAEFIHADRRTDMKLIVVFRNFANAPKKHSGPPDRYERHKIPRRNYTRIMRHQEHIHKYPQR
jgi:hypothetical protein